jgi:hypothetical protein
MTAADRVVDVEASTTRKFWACWGFCDVIVLYFHARWRASGLVLAALPGSLVLRKLLTFILGVASSEWKAPCQINHRRVLV